MRKSKEAAGWPAGPVPVSVVMISLNEAHNLEGVLENLSGWAQEVFLVDSYSSDDTIDIALRYGVYVVQRPFRGFGDQWNFALSELPVSGPWTMKIDPDERLTGPLKKEILEATRSSHAQGLSMWRRLWFMGEPLPVRHQLIRMWRTGSARFTDVTVNEHPIVNGDIEALAGEIEHHDSPDLHHWLDKQNRYSTAEAVALIRGSKLAARPTLWGSRLQRRMWVKKHLFRFPARYHLLLAYHYLFLGAWRAGWVGWAWSRLRTEVYRLREYKLREIRMRKRLPAARPVGAGMPDPRVPQYE